VKLLRGASLQEVEERFGDCAARALVKEWFVGCLEQKHEFLLLMNHFSRAPIGDLAASNWRQQPIDVAKVEALQRTIVERKGYGHLLPVVIRDLFADEEAECPTSTFWLEDGIHRSLAIADLLVKQAQPFTPIEVYYGRWRLDRSV
jgi:hypothetical protein